MSTLANETLLESIYEDLVEELRTDLLFMTQEQIDSIVYKRFEDMSS